MTTTQHWSSDVERIIQPALDAYGEALSAHGQDYGTDGCRCGWQPRESVPSKRRSTGLHIAAAHRRAEKVCDREMDALLEGARKVGP